MPIYNKLIFCTQTNTHIRKNRHILRNAYYHIQTQTYMLNHEIHIMILQYYLVDFAIAECGSIR